MEVIEGRLSGGNPPTPPTPTHYLSQWGYVCDPNICLCRKASSDMQKTPHAPHLTMTVSTKETMPVVNDSEANYSVILQKSTVLQFDGKFSIEPIVHNIIVLPQ